MEDIEDALDAWVRVCLLDLEENLLSIVYLLEKFLLLGGVGLVEMGVGVGFELLILGP